MAKCLESRMEIKQDRLKGDNGNGNGNHAYMNPSVSDEDSLHSLLIGLGLDNPFHLSGYDLYFDIKDKHPQKLLDRVSSKVWKYKILADLACNGGRICLHQSDGESRELIRRYGERFVEERKESIPHASRACFLAE